MISELPEMRLTFSAFLELYLSMQEMKPERSAFIFCRNEYVFQTMLEQNMKTRVEMGQLHWQYF